MLPRRSLLLSALVSPALTGAARAAEPSFTLDVWPGNKAPGDPGVAGAEHLLPDQPGQRKVQRLTDVSRVTLTVFRPAKERDTGAAVVIAPGGGYNILAWDLEGTEVAAWLNSIGVTGIVLKYRVPRPPGAAKDKPPLGPLQDAQRAMSLVRSKAAEWGLDPARLGMLGFSAGGHLTAATATSFDRRAYDTLDAVDRVSCRPDFAVLVYPAYLVEKEGDRLVPDLRVSKDTPPCFFAHAGDDRVPAENSVQMYLALKRAGVPAELHVYASGGHGFGLRPSTDACSTWPQHCEAWLRGLRLLKPKPPRG